MINLSYMIMQLKEKTLIAQFSNGDKYSFKKGTSLLDILDSTQPDNNIHIVLAKVNNRVHNLRERIEEPCKIEWLTTRTPEGIRAYQQTLCLILLRAVQELYPKSRLLIDHSLGKGVYCVFKNSPRLKSLAIRKIKKRMDRIIRNNEPIHPVVATGKAFEQYLQKKGGGIPDVEKAFILLYRCGGITEYLGYPLCPFTGAVKPFDLFYLSPGMILIYPDEYNPEILPAFKKPRHLSKVFDETRRWESILGIQTAEDINRAVESERHSVLIKIAEGLHEKKIAALADGITRRNKKLRVVLIAGPSSSGKTTFTKRLAIQLQVNGLVPFSLSVDDYFLDNDRVPKNAVGKPDFESLAALDIPRLNRDLLDLIRGRRVRLPKFDFLSGKSIPGPEVQIDKNQPILMEGLHALNNELTPFIPRKWKFKVYVSAITQLNITDSLRVSTSDVRLIRRMVRDHQFRNHSASDTLNRWREVREGEEKYIFPFQEQANAFFNSSLMYELCVLRGFAQPLLEQVPESDPAFPEARRLLEFLFFFNPVLANEVLSNSILREFIGNSSFLY